MNKSSSGGTIDPKRMFDIPTDQTEREQEPGTDAIRDVETGQTEYQGFHAGRISDNCADAILGVIASHLNEVQEILNEEHLTVCELSSRLAEDYVTVPEFPFDELDFKAARRSIKNAIAHLRAADREYSFLASRYDWSVRQKVVSVSEKDAK